jgi:type IV pilus assembly protein PilC
MEAGLSFHEAMAKFPDIFSELWVNLAESGESSGNLAAVLSRLAGYLERNAAFRRKIVSALVYPCVLMLAGLSALLFLTLKVIPTFAEIFQGVGLTLPLLTRILLVISGLIRKYIFLAFGILGVGAYVLRRYTRTKKGKRNFELFLFRLPLFGEFFRILVVERFTAEMATLLESGVPILYSLDITEKSVGNLVLADIIRKIKENVRQGKPLSKPMEESGFFELMSVQMVAVGEEIGELPDMFKRLNAFYDEYLETFLNRFTTLFEPVMLVVMGIAIGILVLGMYLPIFDIAKIGKALSG